MTLTLSYEDDDVMNKRDRLAAALRELIDLMQDVIDHEYTPDSFTLQPAKIALAPSLVLVRRHYPTAALNGGEPMSRDAAIASIVEACNAHDTLKAENERLREALRLIVKQPQGHTSKDAGRDCGAMCRIARKALDPSVGEDSVHGNYCSCSECRSASDKARGAI